MLSGEYNSYRTRIPMNKNAGTMSLDLHLSQTDKYRHTKVGKYPCRFSFMSEPESECIHAENDPNFDDCFTSRRDIMDYSKLVARKNICVLSHSLTIFLFLTDCLEIHLKVKMKASIQKYEKDKKR